MPIGSEVHAFAYHPKGLYVLGTGQSEEFMLQDDTYHWEWKPEGGRTMLGDGYEADC